MKPILFLITLNIFCHTTKIFAQDYEVPQNYVLKQKEDYPIYEQDVIKSIDWLERTPWNTQVEKRVLVKAFVIQWIEGSPDVSIEINSEISKLSKNNIELLGSYMYGYTKYALLHKNNFDIIQARLSGITGIITKYKNETEHVKDSAIEKLIRLEKDGKLEDWVITDFSKIK